MPLDDASRPSDGMRGNVRAIRRTAGFRAGRYSQIDLARQSLPRMAAAAARSPAASARQRAPPGQTALEPQHRGNKTPRPNWSAEYTLVFDLHVNSEHGAGALRQARLRGLVDHLVRGGSSPLRRTGKAPQPRGFLALGANIELPPGFSGRVSISSCKPMERTRRRFVSRDSRGRQTSRAGSSADATPTANANASWAASITARFGRSGRRSARRDTRRAAASRPTLAPIEPSSTRGTRTPRAMPACATCRCTRCARRDASRPCVSVVRALSSDRFNVAGRSAAGAPGEDD